MAHLPVFIWNEWYQTITFVTILIPSIDGENQSGIPLDLINAWSNASYFKALD